MSGYAYQWAKRQRVGDSSAKTLLKTYANWASEDYSTWVSNEELELDTELNIQTIRRARSKLVELGYLIETKMRRGKTQSIIVYQMLAPSGSVLVQSDDQETRVTTPRSPPTLEEYLRLTGEERRPSGLRRSKRVENASPLKSEAPPDSTSSPSNIHFKPLQISPEGGRNFDTKKEVVKHEKGLDQQHARRAPQDRLHAEILNMELPGAIPFTVWDMWCEHREAKARDAPWTLSAARVSIKRLGALAAEGQSPDVSVEEAVLRGWTGLFPVHARSRPAGIGASGATAVDWHKSKTGVIERGEQFGLFPEQDEVFMRFKARVVKAAGPGEWMEEMLRDAARFGDEKYDALYGYFNRELSVDASRGRSNDASNRKSFLAGMVASRQDTTEVSPSFVGKRCGKGGAHGHRASRPDVCRA